MTALIVNDLHLSETTRGVIMSRDRGPRGRSLFNEGDRMIPLMTATSFGLENFDRLWSQDEHERNRIERAVPYDLLFLHLVALANGHDELIINRNAEKDPRLPWYGESGNRIRDVGTLLRDQADALRLAHRRTRHDPQSGPIEALLPRLVRIGKVDLTLAPAEDEPTPDAPEVYQIC